MHIHQSSVTRRGARVVIGDFLFTGLGPWDEWSQRFDALVLEGGKRWSTRRRLCGVGVRGVYLVTVRAGSALFYNPLPYWGSSRRRHVYDGAVRVNATCPLYQRLIR